MNNVNMANMAPMGPVGGPMNMMNNGAMGPQSVLQRPSGIDSPNTRSLLNTYIYDYFLRTEMVDCAKAMLKSNGQVRIADGNSNRRDEQGNPIGNGLSDDTMDTDSKEEIDSKRLEDLPQPLLATSNEGPFLIEWFSIFWDMYSTTKGKGTNPLVNQYVTQAQQQSRLRQAAQQDMLRQMRPDFSQQQPSYQMMRNMQNGNMMQMKQANNLPRTAMANSQNNPQAMQMLQQNKAGQMSRDPSDMDGNRPRPSSPGSGENAPSPSKRPRLEGPQFNPNQGGMMPNGRPMGQGMPGQQVGPGPHNPQQVQQMLLANNINPGAMNPDQLQTFANQSQAVQAKTIQTYSQNLQQHHNSQIPAKQPMPNASGPQAQGSPMVQQGPDSAALGAYYNAEMGNGGMRPGPGGNQAGGGSNHALQDYQMQLMLLEQQNKKRLMMARQEQDGMGMGREGGPAGAGGPPVTGGPTPQPFQGGSPPGGRTGASPNPAEQLKRNNQQMNNAGMGSPVPDPNNRSSPNPVNFMSGSMDPSMAPNFYKGVQGVENNMMAAQMNGMRPPPGQPFNGPMSQQQQQQMMAARQQQQQQGQGANPQMQWQGPNGAQMGPQGPQGQIVQGTPQQRSMPPPSAPAGGNANQRNTTASPQTSNAAPPTPQQSNKANPKKKETKSAKSKAATQKKSNSNLNAGVTPAADPPAEPEGGAPATPMTPVNAQNFTKPGQNAGASQGATNVQAPGPAVTAPPVVPQPSHTDPSQNTSFMDSGGMDFGGLDFANPLTSDNVLNDFDFDSFLHDNDQDPGSFDFSAGAFGMEGPEIGTE